MSDLNSNITKLQEAIYGLNFDISKHFLSDIDILKKLLKHKNPNLEQKDIDSMVDGNSTRDALPNNHPIYDEVKKMKSDIREAVLKIIKGQKDLTIEVANANTLIINSIPSIGIQVAAPPFNVPNAIATVNIVTSTLMGIIAKITDMVLYLKPLESLNIVLPESGFNSITAPINIAITSLLALLKPIAKLQEFIKTITEKIQSLTKNTAKQLKKLNKDLTDKLKEKNDIENKSDSEKRTEDLNTINDDIEDLKTQIDNLKNPKF